MRRGVLLVGGGEPTPWQLAVAAAMSAGPGGALSHATAGRVHRLVCVAPATGSTPVDITVPRGTNPRLTGCTVHRRVNLCDQEVVVHRGVRVTSPVRTLIDLTPQLSRPLLEKTVDEGLIGRLWTMEDLVAGVERAGGRTGIDSLRRLMGMRTGSQPVDTHLEDRAVKVLASLGPFETGFQIVIDGVVYVLDIAWPRYKVGVECDGWETRSRSRSKFDRDRRKDNRLAAHGWMIAHLTSAMSDDEMRAAVVGLLLRAAAGR